MPQLMQVANGGGGGGGDRAVVGVTDDDGRREPVAGDAADVDVSCLDVVADLDLETIPDDVAEYARVRVGETEETRTRLLAELEDMIYEKGDVIPLRMDEKFLLRFLRARNFKLLPTYKLFVNYHRFRENHPHFYTMSPLQMALIACTDVLNVVPYREQTGRRLMIYRMGKWNVNELDVDEIIKASTATLEMGILELRAQILGGVVIFDMEGFTLQHAYHVTPNVVSSILELIATSLPIKTHAIHIINESWIFDTVFNLFKPFLGRRYTDMVYFHGKNMESLHKHIDVKYLPKLYGGLREHYSYEDWYNNLQKNDAVKKEMRSLGYSADII